MSIESKAILGRISDLPKLADYVPGGGTLFSEDFSELFGRTQLRLLQSGAENEHVTVFRHNDLLELAANPIVGTVPFERYPFPRLFRNLVFTTNPPVHGPLRQVFVRPLTPKNIPRLAEVTKRIATELVDEVCMQGEIDFCSEFSERLTTRFWGALLDMNEQEVTRLLEFTRAMSPMFLFVQPSEQDAVHLAAGRYMDLLDGCIHRALERGSNEMLQSMAASFDAIQAGRDRVGWVKWWPLTSLTASTPPRRPLRMRSINC